MMVTMQGTRITLEPLNVQKHATDYFEVSQDERIHEYTGNTVPKSVNEIVALLEKYEKYFLNWMIISNENHKVIGIIRLGKPEMVDGILTAGESQFLASQYWRKGHMQEAKKLFYQYVFNELSVEKLYADVWEGNINSQKSLESYGYQRVETRTELFSKTGEYKQKYIYALSKTEFRRKHATSV